MMAPMSDLIMQLLDGREEARAVPGLSYRTMGILRLAFAFFVGFAAGWISP